MALIIESFYVDVAITYIDDLPDWCERGMLWTEYISIIMGLNTYTLGVCYVLLLWQKMSRIIKVNVAIGSIVRRINKKTAIGSLVFVNACLLSVMIYDVRITGITQYVKAAAMSIGCAILVVYNIYLLPFIFSQIVFQSGNLNENTKTGLVRLAGVLLASSAIYIIGVYKLYTSSVNSFSLYTCDYKVGITEFFESTEKKVTTAIYIIGVYKLYTSSVNSFSLYTRDYRVGITDFFESTEKKVTTYMAYACGGFLIGIYFLNSKPVKSNQKPTKDNTSSHGTMENLKMKSSEANK
ncbi:hypothetical protein O9G_005068 [Rozella allomycis CSF55]|uniref:Uncharacterized protein n=1 Tax=Rozella allomycis (strain CSF55) TaxID=988480 RepID=A0A075AV88_ROZAC|nr:hypothetical protein O9G_005068 [Rozella allomycis CSF55]|eukprot:EPZ32469.1 hypothetical protein O9G_005068 [Rozella allomycis CSF55]